MKVNQVRHVNQPSNLTHLGQPKQVFCVFTVMPSKIKMQTSQYRKLSGKLKKIDIQKVLPRIRSVQYSYARYAEKRFTQTYKALYGDAMFMSL